MPFSLFILQQLTHPLQQFPSYYPPQPHAYSPYYQPQPYAYPAYAPVQPDAGPSYIPQDASNNPYLEDEPPVNNPYLDSPPPEVFHAEQENGHLQVPAEEDRDPLHLSPKRATVSPMKTTASSTQAPSPTPAPAPAPTTATARARPKAQPRARSSATPAAGPNPKRKPKDAKSPATVSAAVSAAAEPTDPPAKSTTDSAKPAATAVVRDEFCSFCSGTDARNKAGYPEKMLTCEKCGRSGTSSPFFAERGHADEVSERPSVVFKHE